MHPRHWKLEFRDRDGGLECRLAQGNDRGWDERGPWEVFPRLGAQDNEKHAITVDHLIVLSRRVRETHDAWIAAASATGESAKAAHTAARAKLASALYEAFPEAIHRRFDAWLQDHDASPQSANARDDRLVLLAAQEQQGHALSLIGGCFFEAFGPFQRGEIGVRRFVVPAERREQHRAVELPPEHKKLRVLVLVGNLRDPLLLGRHESAALETLRHVRNTLAEATMEPVLEVVIAAARGALPENCGVRVDEWLGNRRDLERLLQHGTIKGGKRDYHAVMTLGHSDAMPEAGSPAESTESPRSQKSATGIEFDFVANGTSELIPSCQLAEMCRQDLLFALLLNCRSEALAMDFLTRFDHVLATRPMLGVDHAATLCGVLFDNLVKDATLADAVRSARAALDDKHIGSGWSLVHLARTDEDLAFMSRERWLLTKFYGDAYARERDLCLGWDKSQRFDLTHIHVALDIGLRGRVDGADPAVALQRPEPRRPIKFIELLELPHRRWVLRGEPGGGKTTTLRFCALEPPAKKLVLYVRLARWALLDVAATGESLFHGLGADEDRKELVAKGHARAASGDLFVLLDAYDEVPAELRYKVDDLLGWFRNAWPHAVVVVTARPGTELSIDPGEKHDRRPNEDPLDWQRAHVQPLDEDEQRELLARWFERGGLANPESLARQAAAALENCGRRLQEMASNPLMLTILAELMAKSPTSAPDFAWLRNQKRHQILDRAVTTYLERSYTDQDGSVKALDNRTREQFRLLLRRVAWHMTEQGTTAIDAETLAVWIFATPRRRWSLRGRRPSPGGDDVGALVAAKGWSREEFFRHLEDHTGILHREDSLADARWVFFHRYVQEALAAEYWWFVVLKEGMVKRPEYKALNWPPGGRQEAAKGNHDSEAVYSAATDFWTEPYALLSERFQHSGLVFSLLAVRRTRSLGFRVLAALDSVDLSRVKRWFLRDHLALPGIVNGSLPEWNPEECPPSGYWAQKNWRRRNLSIEENLSFIWSGKYRLRLPSEDLPPFGNWRPRALLLELLGERLSDTVAEASDAIEVLRRVAMAPEAALGEIGAIVWCLERAGQRWQDRAKFEQLAPAARLRSVPPIVRSTIEQILGQDRFGKLTREEVVAHFATTQVPAGANAERRAQGVRDLWCKIPAAKGFRMGWETTSGGMRRMPSDPVQLPVFWMQATPVTEAQWCRFDLRKERSASLQPVVDVDWYSARLFAHWLTHQRQWLRDAVWNVPVEVVFDLPTEAEWEWAARGGTTTRYWSGNGEQELARVGWYGGNSDNRLHDVGELPANGYGLHDVHGNTMEYTIDSFRERLPGGEAPMHVRSVAPRVVRGGFYTLVASNCSADFSYVCCPDTGDRYHGLRLVCVCAPQLG